MRHERFLDSGRALHEGGEVYDFLGEEGDQEFVLAQLALHLLAAASSFDRVDLPDAIFPHTKNSFPLTTDVHALSHRDSTMTVECSA